MATASAAVDSRGTMPGGPGSCTAAFHFRGTLAVGERSLTFEGVDMFHKCVGGFVGMIVRREAGRG